MGAAMSLFPTSSSPLIGLRALASASGNSPARTKFNGSPILPSMGRGTPAAQLVLPASVQQLYALYPSILLNLLDVFSTSKILRWLELIHIFANRNDGGPLKAIRSLQDLRRRWIPTDDEMCSIAGVIMTSTSGLDSSRGRNGRQTQESKLLNLAATPQHFRLLEELPTYRRAAALTRRLCYDSERALMELGPFLAKHPWEIYRWAQIFLPQGISLKQLMLRSNGQLPGEPPKEPNGIGIDVVRGARRGRWSAELRTLRGHTTAITAVATSPPNAARSISATGDELGVVRVWDLETGECVARLDARIAIAERDDSPYQSATRGLVIRSLIFPVDDPRKIVVAGDDGHVRIWSIDSAQLLHDMMPPVTNTPRKFGSSSDLQKPQPASDGPEHSGVIVFDNVDDFEVTFAPDELAEDVHDNEMDNAEDADSGHEYAEEIEELDFGVVCSESLSVGNKKMFVTGHRDGSAHIWDIQGRHVQALVGGARDADGIYHSGPILSMAVSKSYGETNDIATGSEDSSIVVWNTTTGKAMRKLGGHMGAVTALAFGHEFWRLVSGGSDGMIKIWDVGSGRCLQTMMAAGPSAPVPSNAKVDPENRYNVNTERGDSWISRIAFAPQNQIRHHPNLSQLVVTGTSDGVFRLWNIALGGQCLHVVKAHDGVMTGLAFVSSPPPAVAAKAMESATKIATEELKGHSGPEDEKIDGSDIESEEEDMNADLRSSARNIPGADDSQQQATVPETSPTEGLNFESAVLLTCGADGIAKLWQIQPRDVVVQAVSDEEGADDFEVDEDGVITTVLSFSTKRVYLYQCVHGFGGHFRGIRGMALTPDLRRLITAGGDHTAKVFDIETSRWSLALSKTAEEGWSAEAQIRSSQLDAREEAEAHKDLILCLAVEPALSNGDNTENTYFITGSTDGTAKVWNAKTAQLVSTLRGHTGWIRCISYAQPEPTKLIVLTGSTDGTARTFVVNTASKGEEKSNFLLEGHAGHVSSVALCGRGSQILALTGSLDGMSRLFDAGTGRLVNTFAAKDTLGTVLCSSFAGGSPVTHVVAGGGPKGALLAWSLDDPTKGLVFVGHEAPVSAVQAFSGTIVSGSNDGTTRVWNIATGDCIQVFSPSAAPVRFVDVNQSIIVVGSDDGFVRSYSLENSSTVPLAKLRGRVGRTPYAQDGQRQYVLRTDYQVWLWDPRTNRRTLAGYVADADAADFVVPIAVKGPHGLERLRLWWFKRGRPFVADASPQSLT
ncbi:WD40-repeat-containing domain protein [Cladochytrium replicatum]|nr:WD40-repeat-containing domain protein [Cladochytrium replicatum]